MNTADELTAVGFSAEQAKLLTLVFGGGGAGGNLGPCAAPTFSRVSGTYATTQSVLLASATPNAVMFYTTDGSVPTFPPTGSTQLYIPGAPIQVASTMTINAIAASSGYTTSPEASAFYGIQNQTDPPTFSLPAGSYSSNQLVSISQDQGAPIWITLDGSNPALDSSGNPTGSTQIYMGPIPIPNYAISCAAPVIAPTGGSYASGFICTITCATPAASIHYTTDGSTPTSSSSIYTGAFAISSASTVKAIASAPGYADSAIASMVFTIAAGTTATPVISLASGTYTSSKSVTITDGTSGASIYYTLDNSTPVPGQGSTQLYSGAITISASATLRAMATSAGNANSAVAAASYTISIPVTGSVMQATGGRLYDTNGVQFLIAGANHLHTGDTASASYANFGVNCIRAFCAATSGSLTQNVANMQAAIAAKAKFMLCMAYTSAGANLSGDTSASDLLSVANFVASNYSTLSPYEKHLMINVANEWGPTSITGSSASAMLAGYGPAFTAIRNAGYKCPLVVDADAFGQGYQDLITNATALRNADPQKNVVMSMHIYGLNNGSSGTQSGQEAAMQSIVQQLSSAQSSTGVPFIVGEFGPGANIGPSPTLIRPQAIISACLQYKLGWMPWALDDNDLSGGNSDNNWFSMTTTGPGYYDGVTASLLTSYGQIVVPLIKSNAIMATDF